MAKAWHDPRVPADDDCVLRPLLERRAAETPDKIFALFADGTAWTYREAGEAARRAARGIPPPGRRAGRHGLVLAAEWPGCPPRLVRAQLSRRGLCADQSRVPRRDSRARGRQRRCAAHRRPCPAPAAPRADRARTARRRGGHQRRPVGAIDGLTLHDETALAPADVDLPPLAREIAPWDTQSIIYTSGTDGAVERRDVLVSAALFDGRRIPLLHRARGPLHGEPAPLPRRRHGGGVRDARQRRVDCGRRRLRHGALLVDRAGDGHDHRDPPPASWPASSRSSRPALAIATTAAHRHHGAAR